MSPYAYNYLADLPDSWIGAKEPIVYMLNKVCRSGARVMASWCQPCAMVDSGGELSV